MADDERWTPIPGQNGDLAKRPFRNPQPRDSRAAMTAVGDDSTPVFRGFCRSGDPRKAGLVGFRNGH
jgi:hypothetical protein